jgi:hypothetical protein
VHINHASSTLAPSSTVEIEIPLEQLVGEVTALASCAIGLSLSEHQNGGLRPLTKAHGAELITQMYALRRVCIDRGLDFEAIARREGRYALLARHARYKDEPGAPKELTEAVIEEALFWSIDTLNKVVAAEMN